MNRRRAGDETAADPDRFVFVRDGFSLLARSCSAPLWMLWQRLWLVLLGLRRADRGALQARAVALGDRAP